MDDAQSQDAVEELIKKEPRAIVQGQCSIHDAIFTLHSHPGQALPPLAALLSIANASAPVTFENIG